MGNALTDFFGGLFKTKPAPRHEAPLRETLPPFIEVTEAHMAGQPDVVADQTPYADEDDN